MEYQDMMVELWNDWDIGHVEKKNKEASVPGSSFVKLFKQRTMSSYQLVKLIMLCLQ